MRTPLERAPKFQRRINASFEVIFARLATQSSFAHALLWNSSASGRPRRVTQFGTKWRMVGQATRTRTPQAQGTLGPSATSSALTGRLYGMARRGDDLPIRPAQFTAKPLCGAAVIKPQWPSCRFLGMHAHSVRRDRPVRAAPNRPALAF